MDNTIGYGLINEGSTPSGATISKYIQGTLAQLVRAFPSYGKG